MEDSCKHRPFVFMLAPSGRSGTNYLHRLLVEADVCSQPLGNALSTEDGYLCHAELLIEYTDRVRSYHVLCSSAQTPELVVLQDRILREFGDGLKRAVDAEGRLPILLKTPRTRNIESFFRLFYNDKLIIIVRDGRDTCESLVKSNFEKNHEKAFHLWNTNARAAMAFIEGISIKKNEDKVLLLRYEDILADPAKAVMKVAAWLNVPVDPKRLPDFEQIPIIGSSEIGREKDGSFTYKTVPAQPNFKPVGRWHSWPAPLRQQFKEIANEPLVYFGYESDDKW